MRAIFSATLENGTPLGWTFKDLCEELLNAPVVHTGEWQAMNTRKSPAHATHELEDVLVRYGIPLDKHLLAQEIEPDVLWAESHFAERVSGHPYNPPPSHVDWPYAVRNNADHMSSGFQFDHTYPERFWPKHAGEDRDSLLGLKDERPLSGIRFQYGDLSDVVRLLVRSPLTRQAYLPVWFPEDTGAVLGQRVPCTLGYHFMIRDGMLSCRYFIRSCDIYRHFRNDVYLACRLTQWVSNQVNDIWSREDTGQSMIKPGRLTMFISSLHMLVGDKNKIEELIHER
jgi:hypothetical protein